MHPYRLAALVLFLAPAAWAAPDDTPQTRLYQAAGSGDLEKAKQALADGADPNGLFNRIHPSLHRAAERGHLELVKLLLARGADINSLSGFDESAVVAALQGPDPKIAAFLHSQGARYDQVTKRGETQLHVAVRRGSVKAAEFLLDKGASVDETDKYDATPLLQACGVGKSRDDLALVQLLLARGADPKTRGHTKATALHEAASQGRAEPKLIELLIAKGVDPNAQESNGTTPLIRAAFHGHDRNVKALLAHKADPNVEDHRGRTALDEAAERDHQEVIALLKEAGAKRGSGVSKYDKLAGRRPAAPAPDRRPAAETSPPAPSDVDKPAYKAEQNPDNYALVMGVQNYPRLPEASFAESDARAMRRHLLAMGYPERNIITLLGPDASRAGLAKNLETKLARLVNERSTVFFYYSGHGAPDPVSGEAYLVPYDGDPEFLKDTAYPLAQLQRKLGELEAKRVIVAMDACFSGVGGRSVLPKGTRPLVTKIKGGLPVSDKVVAFSASEDNQISGTAEEQGHGLFTYYFLKGLNGAAAESGAVTARGLYEYLKPKVMDEAARHNRDQTPRFRAAADAASVRLR